MRTCYKKSHITAYVGCDAGFHVQTKPLLYDFNHSIEIYRNSDIPSLNQEESRHRGNFYECGDIPTKARKLPQVQRYDLLGFLDTGTDGLFYEFQL